MLKRKPETAIVIIENQINHLFGKADNFYLMSADTCISLWIMPTQIYPKASRALGCPISIGCLYSICHILMCRIYWKTYKGQINIFTSER